MTEKKPEIKSLNELKAAITNELAAYYFKERKPSDWIQTGARSVVSFLAFRRAAQHSTGITKVVFRTAATVNFIAILASPLVDEAYRERMRRINALPRTMSELLRTGKIVGSDIWGEMMKDLGNSTNKGQGISKDQLDKALEHLQDMVNTVVDKQQTKQSIFDQAREQTHRSQVPPTDG